MSAPERTFTTRELQWWANAQLGSAILSYAISLALGVQSAVGSMLMVALALAVHCYALLRDRR